MATCMCSHRCQACSDVEENNGRSVADQDLVGGQRHEYPVNEVCKLLINVQGYHPVLISELLLLQPHFYREFGDRFSCTSQLL